MSFTSLYFMVFVFAVCVFYYLVPGKYQWVLLLFASYGFYAAQGLTCIVFLLAVTLTVYLSALSIGWQQEKADREGEKMLEEGASLEERKIYKAKKKKAAKYIVIVCLFVNLGILAVLKYLNFGIDNLNRIFSWIGYGKQVTYMDLLLPLGISFYMFQSLGYLLDVYWKRAKVQKNFFKYALFVSFFPQLGQGPISRYGALSKTLYGVHSLDSRKIFFGLERILWGVFKKLVIADRIGAAVQSLVSEPAYYRGVFVLVEMLFYAVQLYCDFTGGIDITIGTAQLFGIEVAENFLRPFFSKSIKEYWRRWHITMGTWFKDYVFYPFSISKPLRNLTSFVKRHFGISVAKRVSVYTATIVLWIATGIWHGAYWRFVMWGLMNGVIILVSEELEPLYGRFHKKFPALAKSTGYRAFMVIRTFLLMSSLRLFDNARGCRDAFISFRSIFTQWDLKALTVKELTDLGLAKADYLIVAVGVLLLVLVSLLQRKQPVREYLAKKPFMIQYLIVAGLFFSILLFGVYGVGYDSSGFIYNQF
ncbi:MAG: MBOAT family protein [Lachnospiraceae bacterium]|nr:MBOAT family protein [Lachnospiraceae bacterium]